MYLGYPRHDYAIFTTWSYQGHIRYLQEGMCVCLNKCNSQSD